MLGSEIVEFDRREPEPITINEHRFIVLELSVAALRNHLAESRRISAEREEAWAAYEEAARTYESDLIKFAAQEANKGRPGFEIADDELVEEPKKPEAPTGSFDEQADDEIDQALVVPISLIAQLTKTADGRPLSVDDVRSLSESEVESLQAAILRTSSILKKTMESRKARLQRALSGL